MRVALAAVLAVFAASAAASGEDTYRQKCALCHDAGATQAPRVGQPADWTPRIGKGYTGLLRSALQGVPGTAMLPRAGFRELTDGEVAEAVQYMLSTLKLHVKESAVETASKPAAVARVDDRTLAANVAATLRTRVSGVTVEARDGRVALRGMVESGKLIREAEALARGVPGVVSIENHLVGADLFEHD